MQRRDRTAAPPRLTTEINFTAVELGLGFCLLQHDGLGKSTFCYRERSLLSFKGPQYDRQQLFCPIETELNAVIPIKSSKNQ
jgi:hypothetical protein